MHVVTIYMYITVPSHVYFVRVHVFAEREKSVSRHLAPSLTAAEISLRREDAASYAVATTLRSPSEPCESARTRWNCLIRHVSWKWGTSEQFHVWRAYVTGGPWYSAVHARETAYKPRVRERARGNFGYDLIRIHVGATPRAASLLYSACARACREFWFRSASPALT